MKLTLKELELAIPTIDLLESRKIVGGYNEDQNIAFEVNGDDVVVIASPEPDRGYDPRENDPLEQEEHEMYQGEDGRDNEINTGEQNNNDSTNELTVQVPDGWCVLGSIAAAIQAARGCSAAAAIKAADDAFDKCGINPNPTPGSLGISSPSGQEMANLLEAAGFVVTFGVDDSTTTSQNISNHFDNGGAGLGYISNEGVGHMVYLDDYDLETKTYDYYDPVLGTHDTIGVHDCQIILFK